MKISVCKYCTPETGRCADPNCHVTCERYLKEVEQKTEWQDKIKQSKKKEIEIIGRAVEGINQMRKKNRKCNSKGIYFRKKY